jgi:hypothetical protein
MWKCAAIGVGALLGLATSAQAVDVSVDAYADARLVVPSGERSWVDGGLGKLRFGSDQPSPNLRFTEAVAQATLTLPQDLRAIAVVRVEPEQRSGIDALETYIWWRPAAEGDWHWSVKAGAFFPPVSVENDDLGWTSPYTLTPSAINAWVGNELRTIGGEGSLARTFAGAGTLTLTGALFCCNEPAGILIAERGWTLDDRPSGLFERVRLPDATAALFHVPLPARTGLFENIDGNVGWYAGLKGNIPGAGEGAVLYYDNNADPEARTAHDTSWRTKFWAGSLRSRLFGATILAQGLTGDTTIGEYPPITTRFASAFVLASYDIDDWRASLRGDVFETRNSAGRLFDEDGHAVTAAVLWSASSWLRLGGELLDIVSRRRERILEGATPARDDLQFQLSARVFL